MSKAKDALNAEDGVAAEAKAKSPQRTHDTGGMNRPVLRSFYDPKQDCVIDVVGIKRNVRTLGDDGVSKVVSVTTERHVFCNDEAIQEKYKRPVEVQKVEVTDVE
jgi:hypothetical protein